MTDYLQVEERPDYDEGEAFDATDDGNDAVPEGTAAILFAQMLRDLKAAGFQADPDDPDGSKLGGE